MFPLTLKLKYRLGARYKGQKSSHANSGKHRERVLDKSTPPNNPRTLNISPTGKRSWLPR